uniref:Integrase catalytic domain-containing protein n=1 Tax=Panagrolaimus sp. ES5 TaxID=591445 RepID=A0AC34F4R8_9BILA
MNKLLKEIYTNVENPAGFSSPEKLYHEAKKRNKNVTRVQVKEFLENERSYTLFRRSIRKFKRLKYKPVGLYSTFQADLAIMDAPAVRAENENNPYFLVCIDLLSRKIFTTHAASKASEAMIEAFERIFAQSKYVCWTMQTDAGVEFCSKKLLNYYISKDIVKKTIYSSVHKCCFAENAIGRIKRKLYAYFVQNGTLNWMDALPKITKSLNRTFNPKIGMAPEKVTFKNAEIVRKRLWDDDNPETSARFRVFDKVRTVLTKKVFHTGYFPQFSDRIFTVHIVEKQKRPMTYRLIDDNGQILKKQFYSHELCKVKQDTDSVYRIEIIKERKNKKGQKEYYIHYLGYDEYKWVNESKMVNI